MKGRQNLAVFASLALIACFIFVSPSPGAENTAKPQEAYTFSSDWFSYNIPAWTKILGHLKGKPNLAYLEVGVYEGRSFFWVVDNILTHPSSEAVAIDPFYKIGGGDPEVVFRENVRRSGRSSSIMVIKGASQQKLRDLKLNSFDLIYIDGDHSSRNVIMDAIISWDLLKDGGILIFDDYGWDYFIPAEMRPTFALDVFLTLFRDEFQILVKDYQLIVRKAKTYCNEARGSIKVGELTLACSPLGSYIYYWKPKKLHDASTDREIVLSDGEVSLIEKILVGRKLGFKLDVEKKETEQYRSLLNRLGMSDISIFSKEK